jgi:hypothetical protein
MTVVGPGVLDAEVSTRDTGLGDVTDDQIVVSFTPREEDQR